MLPVVATLLAQGLGLLGNAVMNKGVEVINEKLGIDVEKLVQSPEGLQKLRQAEFDHEEFLLTNATENRKIDLEDKRIDVDNTKNARDANARIQESEKASWLAKNSAYLLDWLIVGSTVGMIYALFTKAIPVENSEIAYLATGSLLTMCGTVVNFNRGSSSSSAARTDALVNLVKGKK